MRWATIFVLFLVVSLVSGQEYDGKVKPAKLSMEEYLNKSNQEKEVQKESQKSVSIYVWVLGVMALLLLLLAFIIWVRS